MAMLIQSLSSKAGLATGRNLAELCRERFPRPVTWGLWVQAEVVAIVTDLAEVIGGAIALNLLFLPLLTGGVRSDVRGGVRAPPPPVVRRGSDIAHGTEGTRNRYPFGCPKTPGSAAGGLFGCTARRTRWHERTTPRWSSPVMVPGLPTSDRECRSSRSV